jgi:hypothetical protein
MIATDLPQNRPEYRSRSWISGPADQPFHDRGRYGAENRTEAVTIMSANRLRRSR